MSRNISGCSGTGGDSFVGGLYHNVADGFASGVLTGEFNDACDVGSGIVAGTSNAINSSGNAGEEFIGTGVNNAISGGSDTFIGTGEMNHITAGDDSFIAGGNDNTLSARSAFIGSGSFNTVSNTNGFIGAGNSNTLSGTGGFLGGGTSNTMSGSGGVLGGGFGNSLSGANGVIAGGVDGILSVSATDSVIGGGYKNTASGQYASVGGGYQNTASGTESMVAGGSANTASGFASFAAGYHADANQAGSFVWSDSSSSASTKPAVAYQFVARASGGVKFFSNAAMTTGVTLAAGGGSWASLSDRAVKTNVQPISDNAILDKVAAMPISEWSYISEHGVRHVGPMAQDFYAAFGVGEDNKHITSIDEDGVALAAIKALNARLAAKNAALAARVSGDEKRLARLEARMAAIR